MRPIEIEKSGIPFVEASLCFHITAFASAGCLRSAASSLRLNSPSSIARLAYAANVDENDDELHVLPHSMPLAVDNALQIILSFPNHRDSFQFTMPGTVQQPSQPHGSSIECGGQGNILRTRLSKVDFSGTASYAVAGLSHIKRGE